MEEAAEHLQQAETALGGLLPRPGARRPSAIRRSRSRPSTRPRSSATPPARSGCKRPASTCGRATPTHARDILNQSKKEGLESHNAEYHFQVAGLHPDRGRPANGGQAPGTGRRAGPGHTGALFQLGHANDLAGNDDEAISYYERCLKHPPVHVGALKNLGVLYEDNDKYDKAVECYGRLLKADPTDERARLFFKDAQASLTMYYSPEEEFSSGRFAQVLEISGHRLRAVGPGPQLPEEDEHPDARRPDARHRAAAADQQELRRNVAATRSRRSCEPRACGSANRWRRARSTTAAAATRRRTCSAEEQAVLNKPVSELNLSVRARKCMNRLGINTLGELVQRTADELLEAKNFGMTSLTEVREKLVAVRPEAARRLKSLAATRSRAKRCATMSRSLRGLRVAAKRHRCLCASTS